MIRPFSPTSTQAGPVRARISYAVALVLAGLVAVHPASAANRFGLNLRTGFAPNQFSELAQGDRDTGDSNERIHNRLTKLKNDYSNGQSYNAAPVVGGFRFDNDTNPATTFGLDLRYLWKDFFFQLGVTHYSIGGTRKNYYSTLGPLSTRRNDTNYTAYDDINENYDRDNDYVKDAIGLYPTDGLVYRFREYTTGKRLDIPLSAGIHLALSEKYSLFAGAGLNYHWGSSTRVISAAAENGTATGIRPDIDQFSGSTLGLFYFFTAEYNLTSRIAVNFCYSMNYGTSRLLRDEKITGKGTVNSLFHANDENDEGGPERTVKETTATGAGFQRYATLDFSGFQATVGICYYLTEFR